MSKFLFTEDAWEDYLYWQTQDKKILKRINQLLQDIERNGYNGIGKPEPLRGDLSGFWSRLVTPPKQAKYIMRIIFLLLFISVLVLFFGVWVGY